MNVTQEKILKLAEKKDISKMSFRKICRELGIKNPQTIIYHIEQLKRKGLFYYDTQKRQRVARPKTFVVDNFFKIPVVGAANCGAPTQLAQQDIEDYLTISQKTLNRSTPTGLIAVRAMGKSLNKANINGDSIEDGDYVIVDCKKQPQDHGDYVLSVIDGAANFKKFAKDDNKKEIRLLSESTLPIPPIVLHEDDVDGGNYLVNGVVIKVIKN
jgi:SOS-response transcriptional repressor LexA